jgi:hypothetical protein
VAAVTAVPSLSQIHAWDTTHLDDAATDWSNRAWQWENTFTDVQTEALRPGGTAWSGDGAEAAAARATADKIVVSDIAGRLHTAAGAARTGAEDIAWARQHALNAITTARSAGFTVTEDLSVIPPPSSGLLHQVKLQTQAQTLATDIRARAAELLATDTRVAGHITTATADLSAGFGEHPLTPAPKKPTIQAVDHTIKETPPPPPGPPNNADDVKRILKPLEDGINSPHKQLDNPADVRRLYDWLVRDSVGDDTKKGFPRRVLSDGTIIGIRDSNRYGTTVQVYYPGGQEQKVHLPASIISDLPQLPPLTHPPVELPPLQTAHPPAAPLPPLVLEHPAELPPWLQNPSPPGFVVSPVQPPPMMPWDLPDSAGGLPAPVTSAPPGQSGWSWLPELGQEAADAGKTVGTWLLVIGAAGAAIAGIGSSSGQAAAP